MDIWTDGDKIDGKKSGNSNITQSIEYFQNKLKKFKPTPPTPKYTGAEFVVGDTESNRLEAEIGTTTQVELPLTRASAAVNSTSTNSLVITYPGEAPTTNVIYWAKGEAETNLTVNIPATMTTPGGQVELLLLDAAGKAVATSHVTAVTAPENAPKNPLWIGEKTADELAWGEWTMDLDVATNKVNDYNAGTGDPRTI